MSPSASEVENAAALILRLVPQLVESFVPEPFSFPPEPDCVPYRALVTACSGQLPGKRTYVYAQVREACELLAGERHALELWLKSDRDGRHRIRWVRLPGPKNRWRHPPPQRPFHTPERRAPRDRRGMSALDHHMSPERTAGAEAAALQLLAEPVSKIDMLSCSGHATPPPGPGWVPMLYL